MNLAAKTFHFNGLKIPLKFPRILFVQSTLVIRPPRDRAKGGLISVVALYPGGLITRVDSTLIPELCFSSTTTLLYVEMLVYLFASSDIL